jgi:WhiB family transcriptional regulator, redox-sensing transcriptional regulator
MTESTKLKTWRDQSACRAADPELFFPVGQGGDAMRQALQARSVCHTCPVMGKCLEWALSTRQTVGIWGGLDEFERRSLIRRRNQVQRLLNEHEISDFTNGGAEL